MKKGLLICTLLSCILTTVFCQTGLIRGTVYSKSEVLPFATILIEPGGMGTTSDTTGQFQVNGLPPNSYEISVSHVGLETIKKEVYVYEDATEVLEFHLDKPLLLEEVVITGTMKPAYVSDSPIKVDVITARQLELYIPTAASSVVEGIQLVNGVQEVTACGVCFTNSISINGLAGAYTAILMDGTPMYGNLASVYGLNGIPSMIIDRFEVIKGPSSTLYGSEAVAGVINIITKDPEKQPLLSVDLMGTTHKESFGNIAMAPRLGKASGYIGLNYAYINDFEDQNQDYFGDNISLDRYALFTKWEIDRKNDLDFSIAAKYYYEDRRNGVEEFLKNRAYRTLRGSDKVYGESIYTHRMEIFGTYEIHRNPDLKLDFSLSDHDQDSYYGSDYYQANQRIAFANLLFNPVLGEHDIILGLSSRLNSYDDNTVATELERIPGEIVNNPDNQFIPGLFVQDEWKASSSLTLLAGVRMDHYTDHGFILSPRFNMKIKPGPWTTLRANFGTGFRTVHLFTEDHAFITGQREVVIAEKLEPERSVNVSLNINHVFALLGGTGTIDFESHFTHFSNKIIPDYDVPGQILYANSQGFARTKGFGLNFNYNFTFPLGMSISYNRQEVTETDIDPSGFRIENKVEFAPEWSALFTTNYFWKPAGLTMAYTARFTGSMSLPEVYDLDEDGHPLSTSRPTLSKPFAIHNIQVSRSLGDRLMLYAGAQNLFNFRQELSPLTGYNDPNSAIGFSDRFDTSYAYAPIHGFEFYLGFKWDLAR